MFFCILDSRASRTRVEVIAQSLGFNGLFCIPAIGQCGGIILLWNHSLINTSILEYQEHFIHCRVQDLNNHKTWYATFVYIYPQKDKDKLLWPDIIALKPRIS